MTTNIQNLIQDALGDGARSTKYDVMLMLKDPENAMDGRQIGVLAKASNFPSRSHTQIDFKYKGRSIPIRGQSKYTQTWECTFYLTEDHKLKNIFEIWIESLDEVINYVGSDYAKTQRKNSSNSYVSEIHLFQQNFNDTQATAQYTLYNCFPIEVSQVQVSAEGPGNVLEFSVTFAYSHYTLACLDAKTGSLVDRAINMLADQVGEMIDSVANAVFGELAEITQEQLEMLSKAGDLILEDVETKFENLWRGTLDDYNPGGWFSELVGFFT